MTTAVKLSGVQIAILAGYGVLLWFAAAMLIRVLVPMGALSGVWQVVTYVLVVPGTVPVLLSARPIAKLGRGQMAAAAMIMDAAALLCDGTAFAWFPALYGNDAALWPASAAVILWGAGVVLVLGLLMNRD